MSTLTDPLDPHRAPAASDPAVFGGVAGVLGALHLAIAAHPGLAE
ncbi:MAG: hypothetical protein ACXVGN_05540 [Mycobacteriaceae bacterium]